MLPNIIDFTETFSLLDEWEDKYRYLIELGATLEPFKPELHCSKYKVSGCTSQVWLYPDWNNNKLAFKADSDAHTVKGLLCIALAFYNNKSAQEALDSDISALLKELELSNHISLQRANGLQAVVKQIKYYAKQHIEKGSTYE